MSAFNELVNNIGKEIDRLPKDDLGGVIFDDEVLRLPLVEEPLAPPVDVINGTDMDAETIVRIHEDNPDILGIYIPMHSPGQIVLFSQKIHRFYWRLISTAHPQVRYLTKLDLHGALQLVVRHTWDHEQFHFNCDVLKTMFCRPYDPLLEEALAVTWARTCITLERARWNSEIGRMNGLLYALLMDLAFRFSSPGYRDWPLYADTARFHAALLDYLGPARRTQLQGSGIQMERLIVGMLSQISGGCLDRVR